MHSVITIPRFEMRAQQPLGSTFHGLAAGAQDADSWLTTPEVTREDVQSSWDAVGRIEKMLEQQVLHHQCYTRTGCHGCQSP